MSDENGGKRGPGKAGRGFSKGGGKPGGFKPRTGAGPRPGGKPFRARPERADGGEARGERPRFERPAEGAEGGEKKPFRPRGQRAPGKGGAERRPFFKRGEERSEGENKPFRARSERPSGEGRREDRPRADRAEGERKPFRPFRDRGEGDAPRARDNRSEGGDRKPFTPKSRGMFSHGGRDENGERKPPRSYGRLSHGEASAERRPRAAKPEGERPRRDERPREDTSAPDKMRIAKRLARVGIASRRDAEGMIADGRVKVNGRIIESPALDVGPADRIEIDGAPLPAIERTRLWLFHKPAGTVTTNRDPEGRPTVFDRLPEEMPRVLSVGRLDINTEGLLLLTNDGGLARLLELPATGWLRRYRVRAHGSITQARLDELRQGIAVDGVFYGAIEASLDKEQGSNVWLTLGLREGKNREVKKVLAHLGLDVNRLIRVSFGPFQLGELEEGAVMEIKGRTLRDQLGERLIEEAGADFDAPIVNPFSNKPVAEKPREEKPARAKGEWISASGADKPNRKRFGAAKREDALGRLDTKAPRKFDRADRSERGERRDRPERGERPFGERKPRSFGDRPDRGEGDDKRPVRRPASAGKRTANVWMAPGARAIGDKKKAERAERDALRAERGPSRGPRPSSGAPRTQAPRGPGGDRPRSRPDGGPKRPPRD